MQKEYERGITALLILLHFSQFLWSSIDKWLLIFVCFIVGQFQVIPMIPCCMREKMNLKNSWRISVYDRSLASLKQQLSYQNDSLGELYSPFVFMVIRFFCSRITCWSIFNVFALLLFKQAKIWKYGLKLGNMTTGVVLFLWVDVCLHPCFHPSWWRGFF